MLKNTSITYFLFKLSIFAAIAFVGLVVICTINKYGIRKAMSDDVFRFDKNITTLIAGDSHTVTSLDPDLLVGSINISESSENYVYTFYKLRHLLAINPKIQNIILGFSYHNISKSFPEKTLKDISGFESYYLLLDKEGKALLDSSNPSIKLAKLKYDLGVPIDLYKNGIGFKTLYCKHMHRTDFPFYGKFYKSQRGNINDKDLTGTIKRHYFDDFQRYAGTSKINIEFLYKIAEMCTNKHINLILFMSPLHKRYLDKMPPEAFTNYNEVRINLMNKYTNIQFIDLSRLQLKDEWMGDGDHVNSLGAKFVSIEVQKQMNSF